MSQIFRLAVLECDTPVPTVREARGSYGDVFQSLLAKGLTELGDEKGNAQLCITKWDVVTSQEYPKADEVDGILLTGSSALFPPPFSRLPELPGPSAFMLRSLKQKHTSY